MTDAVREIDATTRAFVVRHAGELFAYFGSPASTLTKQQIHEWARDAGKTLDAGAVPAEPEPSAAARALDVEALEARVRHEILARVFDRDQDGRLELLPAFLDEVETYLRGRVQHEDRSHCPGILCGERARDQQAIVRRLTVDVAHAFLAIRYPLHVTSVEGFRLLDRVDTEVAFWFGSPKPGPCG